MSPTLKQKTVSGIKWQVANNVLQKVITVATFAVLARILEPSVFGLFAMAFIAIDGLGLFKTFGMDAGIVAKKDIPDEARHTAFWLIQAMGIVLCALCIGLAPVAAHFFKEPEVGSVLRALGFLFVLSGFGRVPNAVLTKQMRFKHMSLIELTGSTLNCICAVTFALRWPTVWSLAGAYLIKQFTMTSLVWYFSGYRVKWSFQKSYAKELFSYGKFLIGISIISYLGMNFNNVLVGKILGAAALGYYALALNISNFINTHFAQIVSRVTFPAFSLVQDDPEALKSAYLKTLKMVSMLSIPFSLLLICLGQEFVLTIYGSKWLPIVPLIILLGVFQIIFPLTVCSGPVFRGCGKPKYEFNFTLWNLIIKMPIMYFLTLKWGLVGTVASGILMISIFGPINVYLVKKLVRFRYSEFFANLTSSVLCGVVMVAVIMVVKTILIQHLALGTQGDNHLFQFCLIGSIGVLSYAMAFYLIDRPTSLEVRRILFNPAKV